MKDEAKAGVKARSRHAPSYKCAFCHDPLEEESQAPCAECGALLHPACRVENGGCTTLGCAGNAERTGPREQPRTAPARARLSGRTQAAALAWTGIGAGGLGMVLSFLVMAVGATSAVMAGAAGFVAGAVLIAAGLMATALLARRRRDAPTWLGAPARSVGAVLSRLGLLAGVGGMSLSFLFLAFATHLHDGIGGMAGFVAGSVLVLGGLVSCALLAEDEEPEE